VSDAAAGQHRKVEFYGPISQPTNAANKSFLYSKDVSAKVELHWEDEDGDEIQLTDGGAFNMALLTSKTLTTPTLTSPVINTGVSGTAVLDEDDLATDSDTQLATQQSIKAYVDNSFPDDDAFGTWIERSNTTSYLAATDGFVVCIGSVGPAYVYTDSADPPITSRYVGESANFGACVPVKKGDYWKTTGTGWSKIYWLPVGG
jgi:hypothetical protein